MSHRAAPLAAALLLASGCASTKEPDAPRVEPEPHEETAMAETPEPVAAPLDPTIFAGPTTPEAVLLFPSWRRALDDARAPGVDAEAAAALAGAAPGARVVVYLGAWCPDSVREVTRMWRALEAAGAPPFPIEYVALDRSFQAGEVDIVDRAVIAVPTIVVERGGAEVGRIVERPVASVERDLADLLTGAKSGWISETRPEPGKSE